MPMTRERDDRDRYLLPQAKGDQRHTCDDESDEKSRAEPSHARQREGADRTQERADSDRGIEIADAAVPEVESVERHDDDEHLQGTSERRLGREEQHDHSQRRVVARAS